MASAATATATATAVSSNSGSSDDVQKICWLSSLVETLLSLRDLQSVPHALLLMIEEYTVSLPTLVLFGEGHMSVRRSNAPVSLTLDCSSPMYTRGVQREWSLHPSQLKTAPLVTLRRLWKHWPNIIPSREWASGACWNAALYCLGMFPTQIIYMYI